MLTPLEPAGSLPLSFEFSPRKDPDKHLLSPARHCLSEYQFFQIFLKRYQPIFVAQQAERDLPAQLSSALHIGASGWRQLVNHPQNGLPMLRDHLFSPELRQ